MSKYKIRAHHGMCLAFFEGKGYNSAFTKHMAEMKEMLSADPVVRIIAETDDICSACPNNKEGKCESEGKAAGYDSQVLSRCHLKEGTELNWKAFEQMILKNILEPGRRKEICGDCQWDTICSKIF